MEMVELERQFSELLATRDTDSLNRLIPEVLSGIDASPAYPIIGRSLVRVNTDILGKPGRSVIYLKDKYSTDVPRKLSIYDPVEIPEGGAVPQTHQEIEYVESIPKKYGKRPLVTKELIEDAAWNVIARNTAEVMRAAKEFEDKKILDTLFDGATTNTFTSTAADTLSISEIRNAIKRLHQYGHRATDIIVSPDFWENMMQFNWAVAAATADTTSASWKERMFNTGNMPPIFGIPVTMTALLEDSDAGKSRAMVLERQKCGALTLKRDWTLESVSDPVTDQQGLVVTSRFDVAVIQESAIVAITSL